MRQNRTALAGARGLSVPGRLRWVVVQNVERAWPLAAALAKANGSASMQWLIANRQRDFPLAQAFTPGLAVWGPNGQPRSRGFGPGLSPHEAP